MSVDAGPASGAAGPVVVLLTGPDLETMGRVGEALVGERLAACVNLVPGLVSVYRWRGAVEQAHEVLAIAKTTRDLVAALERKVRELHPYDLPEVIVLPVTGGSADYLDWVTESVGEAAG